MQSIAETLTKYAGFDMDLFFKKIDRLFTSGKTNVIILNTFDEMKSQIENEIKKDAELKEIMDNNNASYIDLIVEYYTRKMIVNSANKLLYRLSGFKASIEQYYNIMNADLSFLNNVAVLSDVARHINGGLNANLPGLVGNAENYVSEHMHFFNANTVMFGNSSYNTKSFLCVLKCLARDMP